MSILIYLIPIALFLGALSLLGFLWALSSGQYEDLDGAAERMLLDDETIAPGARADREDEARGREAPHPRRWLRPIARRS